MWTFFGIGYGPGSLSSAYWNLSFVHFLIFVPSTTSYGIPIGPPAHLPEPKSGWRPVPAPMLAMIASEFDATGSESTRVFHGLSAGNIGAAGQPGSMGGAAEHQHRDADRERLHSSSRSGSVRLNSIRSLRTRSHRKRKTSPASSPSPCTTCSQVSVDFVARGTYLEGVILVLRRPGRPAELANDHAVLDARLLVQLAQEALLERLAGIEAARRNLRPGGRIVPVVEDEQLLRAVPLARDVREDALPHVLALSDALYARFAAW